MTRAEHAASLKPRLDPYLALVAAILHQAVDDARRPAPRVHGLVDASIPAQAIAYLRDTSPQSGLTCLCDLTDADEARVRPALMKAARL